MNDFAIRVENLSKLYHIGEKLATFRTLREVIYDSLKSTFRRHRQTDTTTIWALEDVSFEIKRGEAIGIIGRNGSGKSTLLKILSRITPPTRGRVEIFGRVGSLLEVGTGFNPDLTGRENIFLNGAFLGMGRLEMRDKFDQIVEFSEIEQFLDTPVKHYSSGMYVRLAFSIAAHLDSEIIVLDEVLAVGDADFQKKSLAKMEDVLNKEGRTILFVSHSMASVEKLCSRAILLSHGRLLFDGPTSEAVEYYLLKGETADLQSSKASWLPDPKTPEASLY